MNRRLTARSRSSRKIVARLQGEYTEKPTELRFAPALNSTEAEPYRLGAASVNGMAVARR